MREKIPCPQNTAANKRKQQKHNASLLHVIIPLLDPKCFLVEVLVQSLLTGSMLYPC